MIPAWLSGIWAKIVFGAVFVGLIALACLRLIGIGRKAERADQLQRNAETQERITNADARGPRTASDVDRRLSDGTF